MKPRLTFLGTGTSCGVPQIGCACEVCTSKDPRDNRLRASALLDYGKGRRIIIDCGPDFRQQILRAGAPEIDMLLVTHSHYDHVGGIDDLRPYCYSTPEIIEDGFPIYCRSDVAQDLRERMPYCFKEHPYPGVPHIVLKEIAEERKFLVDGDLDVLPLDILHTPDYHILGYRIGSLGYVTDCNVMPERTRELLRGVDTLVINALRIEPHPSHMNLTEALSVIKEIEPRRAYLTHMSHQIGLHEQVQRTLPDNVMLAYDGLTIEV